MVRLHQRYSAGGEKKREREGGREGGREREKKSVIAGHGRYRYLLDPKIDQALYQHMHSTTLTLLVTAQHRRGLASSVEYTLPYLPKMYRKLEISVCSFDQNGTLFRKGCNLITNLPFTCT